MTEVVSPLRAPEPRHPDQAVLFESPIDTTFAVDGTGAAIHITIRQRRTARQKCSACGKRRVLFFIGLGDAITSPPMCARCTGLR
jgi:hypothetical protein